MGALKTLVALAASAPSIALAGGFQIVEQSAAAGGTAGAGIARTDDPAAAWYGPAGIEGDGWRFAAGMLAVSPRVQARATDGSWSERTEQAVKTPPQLYASWARGRFATGASVNVPFGSGVAWPAAWEGRYEIVSSSLQVVRTQPFASWRFGRVRIAAGPHLDYGRLQIARKVDFVNDEGDVAIDMQGTGVGAHAALHWEASDRLAIGATWKSRTKIPLKGTADFEVPDAFTGRAHDQWVTSEITMPDVYAAGVAWRPSARWTVLADLGVTDWSTYDRVVIDFEDPDTTDVVNRPRWQARPWLRMGAERRVGEGAVRAGLLADPSPAPDDALAPSSPDSHRVGATAGFGWNVGRGATVDGFYEYLRLLDRTSKNEEALAAKYRGEAHFVGVAVRVTR